MTSEQELELLLYNSPYKNSENIQVKHSISFQGNILNDNTTEMIRIMKILIDCGFTNMKHTIYLDKKQEGLTRNNTYFDKFHNRIHRYFDILKIILGYDNAGNI